MMQRVEGSGTRWVVRPWLLAVAAVFLLPGALNAANAAAVQQVTPAERLEPLVEAEQRALDGNDTRRLLLSGKQLGALALQLLGALYTGQGQCEKASEAFQQSIEVDDSPETLPDRVQTGLMLVRSDLCADHPAAADRAAEQVVRMAGDTAQVHLLIGNARHGAGDLSGTIAALSRAITLEPQFGAPHMALGDAFWELNEYQYNLDTLREFTIAQHLTPSDFFANQDLGSILSQYERYEDAVPYFRNAIAADSSSPDPWLALGMNAYAQSRWTEASDELQKAVGLTGKNESLNRYQIRRAYAALSRIEAHAGHEAEAGEFARREGALHAEMLQRQMSTPLSESTGLIASHEREREPSGGAPSAPNLPAQQKVVEQRLKSIVAKSLNDAGTVLARERNYAAALPLFRIAAAAEPGFQPVMRNLGLAAFHSAAYQEAVTALERALEQTPGDSLIQRDLEQSRALLAQSPQPQQP